MHAKCHCACSSEVSVIKWQMYVFKGIRLMEIVPVRWPRFGLGSGISLLVYAWELPGVVGNACNGLTPTVALQLAAVVYGANLFSILLEDLEGCKMEHLRAAAWKIFDEGRLYFHGRFARASPFVADGATAIDEDTIGALVVEATAMTTWRICILFIEFMDRRVTWWYDAVYEEIWISNGEGVGDPGIP
eukprot:Gb_23072 [translate_table: standard]